MEDRRFCFSGDIAKRYGVNAAIILENLRFWISHNRDNGMNFYDGKYWTYNSMDAFQRQFEFLTVKQIRGALDKLKEEGVIITGNYNQSAFDRTTWYALTEYGESLFRITRESENPKPKEVEKPQEESKEEPKDEPKKKPKEKKTAYGEYQHVMLTDKELDQLQTTFGEIKAGKAITYLDEYIEEKGYSSKSHYLAIRRWVIKAVEEKEQKGGGRKPGGYDWDAL